MSPGHGYSREVREALAAVKAPPYLEACPEVNRWMVRKGYSAQRVADDMRLGRSTLNQWLQGSYEKFHPQVDSSLLTARIWAHMQSDPAPAPQGPPARMLETRNAAEIRRLVRAGLSERAVGICYGAPASEKTFIVKCVIAEQQAAGRDDILYLEASPRLSALALLQMLASAAGTAVRSNQKWPITQSLVENFRARKRLPLLVVDEAQHLLHRPYDALETLKEINNRTREDLAESRRDSAGCGILLFGSHLLFQSFRKEPLLLAQWRRRITHERQLTGMNEGEAQSRLDVG